MQVRRQVSISLSEEETMTSSRAVTRQPAKPFLSEGSAMASEKEEGKNSSWTKMGLALREPKSQAPGGGRKRPHPKVPLTREPGAARSVPLTVTGLGDFERPRCPADGVADVAGVSVPASDADLLFQFAQVPRRVEQLAPSIPGIADIVTSGDRAGQGHLAPPSVQGFPLLQQAGLLNRIWGADAGQGGAGNTSPAG